MGDGTEKNPFTREDVIRLIKGHGGPDGLDLSGKVFEEGIDLSELNLEGIILKKASLLGAHLEGASLKGVDLEEAVLWAANLEGTNLEGALLRGVDLPYENFKGANLRYASLEYAFLLGACLEGADLQDAQLKGAYLMDAHLEEAILTGAELRETDLSRAHLEGASLDIARLDGADLSGAYLMGACLADVEFPRDTKLEGVDWGNYVLGEEGPGGFNLAADTYRRLKTWYTEHGIYDIAGEFFYREMEAKRKAQSWKEKPHLKLWNWSLRLLCGYGEKPLRVVLSGISVLFGFGLLYFFSRGVAPYNFTIEAFSGSLYYSAVSFTALGYGPWFGANSVRSWVQGIGVAEAFSGVFMMALFLVTFTRKMTR